MIVKIGIDTGVHTGFALSVDGKLARVESLKIHKAMEIVSKWAALHQTGDCSLLVRVEDARLRKWIPKIKGKEVFQGVGSVKRDAGIWEDFLRDLGVPFEMVAPKNNITKLPADRFKNLTGWQGRTNEHSRDGAMVVFGL